MLTRDERHPFPASLLVLDVRRFGVLTNVQQLAVRRRVYTLLVRAFTEAGLTWPDCTHEDRGDGVFVVIPASVPKPVLLDDVLGRLAHHLGDATGEEPLRMRVAVHAGEVHHDGLGFVGSDVNHTFRLAESAVLHQALERGTGNCALLVSDVLYQGIVRHGYGRLDPATYHPVPISEKETRTTAWLHIPGDNASAAGLSAELARPAPTQTARTAQAGGISLSAGGNQRITGSVIATGNVTIDSPHGKAVP